MSSLGRSSGFTWPLFLFVLSIPAVVAAQGVYAPGLGPVNRAMGSAAVAAPIDGMGALAWNPATLSGMEGSELSFSVEMLIADIETASSITGLGAGVTKSDAGVVPLPNMAWVHRTHNNRLSIGLGIQAVAGFKTNFPADPTNPILAPQRSLATFPLGGLGRVYSEASFIDISPTMAYALTDRLSIGFSPVVTMGMLELEPVVVAGVNDANADGVSTYPRGMGSRYHWGAGVNLGAYYVHNSHWRFGASVKTPRWMEDFTYYADDEIGGPISGSFDLDLPMVISLGTSYTPSDRCLVAIDVRYIDYENAAGFGDSGIDASGAVLGLGWESIFAVGLGLQYQVSECLVGRLGYVYNENPIPDALTQFNIAAPLHYEHTLSTGLSYQICSNVTISGSYSYSFDSEISGPITLAPNPPTAMPPIPVPGSSVSSTLRSHAFDIGVAIAY